MTIDLYLIRHAQSDGNLRPHIVGGQSNHFPLTELGRQQASLLGNRLKQDGVQFDAAYCSTAVRTRETAQIAGQYVNLQHLQQSDKLLELDQGQWQGRTRSEVYTPQVLARINSNNWGFRPPGGESQREVEYRMMGWLEQTMQAFGDKNATIGVFGHGMAFKCLLRGLLGFPAAMTYKIKLDNTSITQLRYDDRGWHLKTVNDVAHLKNYGANVCGGIITE